VKKNVRKAMYTLSDIAMLVVNETNEQNDKEKTN